MNVVTLTHDDRIDHAPRLAAGGDKALLVWTKSQGLKVAADDEQQALLAPKDSDGLYFSVWDGSSWSGAEPIEGGLPTVVDSYVAMDGDEGLLLYTLDMDDDPVTMDDQEIFARIFDGNAWEDPIRLSQK